MYLVEFQFHLTVQLEFRNLLVVNVRACSKPLHNVATAISNGYHPAQEPTVLAVESTHSILCIEHLSFFEAVLEEGLKLYLIVFVKNACPGLMEQVREWDAGILHGPLVQPRQASCLWRESTMERKILDISIARQV